MYEIKEIVIHGKTKYELVYVKGGKHIAYFNDRGEAYTVLRLLNRAAKE